MTYAAIRILTTSDILSNGNNPDRVFEQEKMR